MIRITEDTNDVGSEDFIKDLYQAQLAGTDGEGAAGEAAPWGINLRASLRQLLLPLGVLYQTKN